MASALISSAAIVEAETKNKYKQVSKLVIDFLFIPSFVALVNEAESGDVFIFFIVAASI
jgi:hypothetical protein